MTDLEVVLQFSNQNDIKIYKIDKAERIKGILGIINAGYGRHTDITKAIHDSAQYEALKEQCAKAGTICVLMSEKFIIRETGSYFKYLSCENDNVLAYGDTIDSALSQLKQWFLSNENTTDYGSREIKNIDKSRNCRLTKE